MKSKAVSKSPKPEAITNKDQLMKSKLVKENSNFTPDQIGDLWDAFECFSNPTTKLLNMKDFVESLRIYGYERSKSPILRIMLSISQDAPSEQINFEQFMGLLCDKIGHPSSEAGRQAIFKLIDAEDKQFITQDDIKNIAQGVGLNVSSEDLSEIYMTYKKTKESQGITLNEFEKYLVSRFNIVAPSNQRRITEIKH